jgi:hypothetical protein
MQAYRKDTMVAIVQKLLRGQIGREAQGEIAAAIYGKRCDAIGGIDDAQNVVAAVVNQRGGRPGRVQNLGNAIAAVVAQRPPGAGRVDQVREIAVCRLVVEGQAVGLGFGPRAVGVFHQLVVPSADRRPGAAAGPGKGVRNR